MENNFKNIDDLFKEQVNKLPDEESMMEDDWDEMKLLLVPTFTSGNGTSFWNRKNFFYLAACITVFIGIAILIFVQQKNPVEKNTAIASNNSTQTIVAKIDTIQTKTNANDSFDYSKKTVEPFYIPEDTAVLLVADSSMFALTSGNQEPTLSLEAIYAQLREPVQFYTIDNTRDTTLVGKKGSKLFIPANSFQLPNGNPASSISILMEEFYTYSEMLAAKLTTLSNGQQLETGGMVNIQALADGKEVTLKDNKPLNLQMPTKMYNPEMELFTGIKQGDATDNSGKINWALVKKVAPRYTVPAKVFNLRDEPYKTFVSKDKIGAKFLVTKKCALSNDEIIQELKKRYPTYYKIKIRRTSSTHSYVQESRNILFQALDAKWIPVIGDTIDVQASEADKYNLWGVGQKEEYLKKKAVHDSIALAKAKVASDYYSFSIQNFGWINCDRFYNDPRPKVNFAINTGENADQFVSQLIFTKFMSIMAGSVNNSMIYFPNVPIGEEVQFISVGIKNNKVVTCTKKIIVGKETFSDITYTELKDGTPELKKQFESLNLP